MALRRSHNYVLGLFIRMFGRMALPPRISIEGKRILPRCFLT